MQYHVKLIIDTPFNQYKYQYCNVSTQHIAFWCVSLMIVSISLAMLVVIKIPDFSDLNDVNADENSTLLIESACNIRDFLVKSIKYINTLFTIIKQSL